MDKLNELTVTEFQKGLREKKFKAAEVVKSLFEEIKRKDGEIRAYLDLYEEEAFVRAEEVDLMIEKGEEVPPLGGVPLAIKDNMLIEGKKTTAGSKILEKYIASYDAHVIKKLKEQKSVFLGKTNLDEFAMGSSTENSAFQITKNPHDPERVPGGSSGGSAAAVAANLALGALGSDTGGSIRQPASFCGVTGLKPTYGAVSRFGLIAMASSLDQIGTFGKTAEDAAKIFSAISGKDDFDSTSADLHYGKDLLEPDFEKIKELRIGIPGEYFAGGLDPQIEIGVERAIRELESKGFKTKSISLPHTKYAISCYYIIMPAEVSANLARFDGIRWPAVFEKNERPDKLLEIYLKTRGLGLGAEPKRRILLGAYVLSAGYYDAYYGKAQQVRAMIKNDFDEAYKEVDVILAPTNPTPPFKIGEKASDPLSMYLSDIFTIPASLAGIPSLSVPVKGASPLPVGFQLMGKKFREPDILGIGRFYQNL